MAKHAQKGIKNKKPEITKKDSKTELRFTHVALVPGAWGFYNGPFVHTSWTDAHEHEHYSVLLYFES